MLEQGQKVLVNYAGQLEDGYEFVNTWLLHEPVHVTIGENDFLPKFQETLVSMRRGERKGVDIPAEQAYGAHDPALVVTVPASRFPDADKLPVGSYIGFQVSGGTARARVVEVSRESVTLDCNHELAGHDLHFDIELVDDGESSNLERELETTGCGCDKLRESLTGCCEHAH